MKEKDKKDQYLEDLTSNVKKNKRAVDLKIFFLYFFLFFLFLFVVFSF